jgi:membrane-bound ClpP family serine protease
VRGLTGPVLLITLGALLLVGQFSGAYSFSQLWPVLLIVLGILRIVEALVPARNHREG